MLVPTTQTVEIQGNSSIEGLLHKVPVVPNRALKEPNSLAHREKPSLLMQPGKGEMSKPGLKRSETLGIGTVVTEAL